MTNNTSMRILTLLLLCLGSTALTQTVYVPSGTSGIGSSSNSNVGIGTADPGARLEISRDADYGNYTTSAVHVSNATTPAKAIRMGYDAGIDAGYFQTAHTGVAVKPLLLNPSGGNVGIGTTAPAAPLDVYHPSSPRLYISGPGGTSPYLAFHQNGTEVGYIQYLESGSTDLLDIQSDGDIVLKTAGEKVRVLHNGNVGIGTTSPSHKLAVNGTIKTKAVIVETTGWADHVFADDYRLAPLDEVEAHIRAKRHLPGIPSAAEVAQQGISVGEMQARLLEKIEELTLHQIEQAKRLDAQANQLEAQTARIEALEAENAALRGR